MAYNAHAESLMFQQDQPWNLQPNVQRYSSSSSLSSDSDSDACSSSFEECGSCVCVEPLSMNKVLSGIPTSICCDAADREGADNGCFKSNSNNSKNSSRSWLSVSTLVRTGGLILVALVLASAAYSRHSLDSRARAGLELSEQNSLSQDLLIVAERDAHAMQRDNTSLQAANDQLLSELSR